MEWYCFFAQGSLCPKRSFYSKCTAGFQIRLDIRVFLSKEFRQKQFHWSACSAYSGSRPGRRHLRRGRTKAKNRNRARKGEENQDPPNQGYIQPIASTYYLRFLIHSTWSQEIICQRIQPIFSLSRVRVTNRHPPPCRHCMERSPPSFMNFAT